MCFSKNDISIFYKNEAPIFFTEHEASISEGKMKSYDLGKDFIDAVCLDGSACACKRLEMTCILMHHIRLYHSKYPKERHCSFDDATTSILQGL